MKRRRLLALVGLIALVLIFVFNFGYVNQFAQLASRARWYVLALVLVAQAFSYYCNALYYKAFFTIFDYHISTGRLFKASLAINFVNQAFPSGGVSGTSYLSRFLQNEVPAGKTTLAQLGYYVFTFLSFLAVLIAGFILLLLGNDISKVTVRIVLLFIVLIIVTSLLLVTVVADRRRVEQVVEALARKLNHFGFKVLKRRKAIIRHAQLIKFLDEFYEGYDFLLHHRGKWRNLLGYCLGGNIAEVATVYVVFAAFGSWINPGVVIVGYTLANTLSIISVISSGAGLYEATMVGAFAALGVPFALALSVVIVYRVLNFLIFLPLGYYIYHQQVSNS